MFTSILFLNGTLPDLSELPRSDNTVSIAADGGTLTKLQAQGFTPNFVVGDGDSLQGMQSTDSFQVILNDDQETTDFEKCLEHIQARSLFPTLVCGVGGGEIDHQHNNLHCFAKYTKSYRMLFLDTQPGYKAKIGFAVRKSITLEADMGSTLSLLPFPEARITTKGLEWPLRDEVLAIVGRSGARNRSSEAKVRIDVGDGGLVLVVLDAFAVQNAIVDDWKIDNLKSLLLAKPSP